MGDNVQCPVCTLYLLPGMDLSDHLETHPKEQVIKALVQLSLKSESTEIVTPDTPKKAKNISSFVESSSVSRQATEDERTTPLSEISGSGSGSSGASVTLGIHDKRREIDDNSGLPPLSQNGLNRQCGYLIENNSSSSSSSSSNFFGPPTPYYRHHSHHNHHQQQQQQQQQSQVHYHPYHGHPHGGGSSTMGIGPAQPPLRLFSYQAPPKPLQPPPAYGTAISQLRSQNSQNLNLTNVNRSLLHTSYTPTSSSSLSSSSSSSAMTQSRLPPPLPPPPLSQRYQPNFPHDDSSFNDSCENSAMSPRRSSMTPPTRPPPQLYRSPLSSSGQYSRQSSSPYSVMTGSPSVLRFAESPVTAQYLERENGDFIVQETPKHVVECVEKDDGEFSVIERVYHMPPSVVQINEDQDDDMSDQGSNSDDMKTLEDDRPNGTWSAGRSPEHSLAGQQRQQKKSGITVLSDVQLDINEYLDLMGNIIALSKAAKTRTEMIKIEKIDPEDPDEVKEELRGSICLDETDENNSSVIGQKEDEIRADEQQDSSEKPSCPVASTSPFAATPSAESPVVPGTTSVIRLAANSTVVSNTTTATTKVDETSEPTSPPDAPVTKVEEAVQTTSVEMEVTKVEEAVQTTIAGVSLSTIEESTNTPTETKTEDALSNTCPESQPTEQEEEKEIPTTTTLDSLLDSTEPPTSTSAQPQPDENPEEEQTSTTPSTQAPATQDSEEMQTPTCTKSLAMDPPTEPTQPIDLPVQSELFISHVEHSVKFEITEIIEKPEQEEEEPEKQPDKPQKVEKQVKKQENPPIVSYHHQTVKRPIKKVPKKLVIKPKSKNSSATTLASQTPTPKPTATATSTATATLPPTPSTSTEAVALEPEKVEVMSEAEVSQEEMRCIKMETLPIMTLEPIPPPLFADADEKLPPDDDVQPSTSSLVTADHEDALPAINPSKEKPTADLAAFLDECMKKEVVEEHPMHSIFGMEIEETGETLDDPLSPQLASGFPSASLFSKPLLNSEHLSISESVLPDSNDLEDQDPHQPQQQQQQNNSAYVEYPFSFLYNAEANHQEDHKHSGSPPMYCSENFNKYSASTSCGNSASCTWYQSQSSENDFEIDGKGSYLDLDSCKRSASFAAATEGSMPTTDTLNIRTDEKMPAKGEISEQESNCGVENSWSQPLYNARFSNPYHNIMALNESWSHDHYFRPQDLSSSIETKNFSLRLTEESPIMDTLPSTSKRKNKAIAKLPRKKTFQCTHCSTHFPLLKEKNAHLIKQHGYKRVNRRLVRDPPTSTVTTATMNTIEAGASLLLGLEQCALPPPPLAEEEDSKAAIVKIEQENQEQKDCKKNITSLTLTSPVQPTSGSISRTKYDSMRARDNRMLINFNLNALNVKNEGEVHSHYIESKSSFCCFVCKRDFLTVKLYDEHLNEHPAECFTCHKKFTRWKNFMVHLKRHLGWKDFGCTFCEKKFVIRSALVEHMRMHTGQTPLKCKICGKSFKRYSNLTQHRKRHGTKINRSKEYVCFCGEVLPSKARFIWHKETHDLKPKCCPYCRDRFVHANSLRRHIRLAHSDKFDYTEPMECPMCKQIYAKSSIKAHMATHTIDTQHECLICNKSFSTKWNLKIHNWVHANRTTKPYKCDQCVKAFVREVDYNNHMNSHKQIKPYTCEHCGCKFIRKYNYIRHRREHHGNKKFTCDLCGKLFHRHYYLIEHRRIHTGERPFQCTICGKSSTTKTNHNKHLKIHHSRDPFTSEA